MFFSRSGLLIITSLCLFLYTVINLTPEETYKPRKHHEELIDGVASRQINLIEQNNKKSSASVWSGYYANSSYGKFYLSLERNVFVQAVRTYSCLDPTDMYIGKIKISDGKLKLIYSFRKEKSIRNIDELVPVLWGDKHYLVPSSRMLDFMESALKKESPCNYWDECNMFYSKLGESGYVYYLPKVIRL